MEKGTAIITGADGGMGQIITIALAREGFRVIMACRDPEVARPVCDRIRRESGNQQVEVREINLASLDSVCSFADKLLEENHLVSRLINNAGVLTTNIRKTKDGLDTLVCVNYVSPYLLTRKLLPLMAQNARVINTVSCTYAMGRIEPGFFENGKSGHFSRIPVYGNTKLALLLFTQELAGRVKKKGITVNAADPGIVSTNMIKMKAWFDPLTDLFFRPFIRTAEQGAATAIYLALSAEPEGESGHCYANSKKKKLAKRIQYHIMRKQLWEDTEELLSSYGVNL